MKSFFPKLKPTISKLKFRVFAWPCITSKHHFVSKGLWNRFFYCPLFNNSYGNRTLLKQDDLDWSVLTWPFLFKFSPHNCITELFTINLISLNAKTTKRLFDRHKWIKLLVVSKKSIISADSKWCCRELNIFPGLQETRIFLKVKLFTADAINQKRQKISVVTECWRLSLLFHFATSGFFRSQSEFELFLCSNRIFSHKMLIKTAID